MEKQLKVKYDDKKITLTKEFVEAIKNLMREEILMMRKVHKDTPECWQIGVCEIEDLGKADGFSFVYGGKEDESWMKSKGQIFVSID